MVPKSEEPLSLLSQHDDEHKRPDVDVESEAGSQEPPRNQNLDHEYSIPSTVKFTWLGAYFFFSLLLTIYNKLVLRVVSLFVSSLKRHQSLKTNTFSFWYSSSTFHGCLPSSTPPSRPWAHTQ